jgi:hypothetical protein
VPLPSTFKVRLLYDPIGVKYRDVFHNSRHPKKQNHPCGGFFIYGSGVEFEPLTGSKIRQQRKCLALS